MWRLVAVGMALFAFLVAGTTQASDQVNLSVLYVGTAASPRAKTYTEFLRKNFRHAHAINRADFKPNDADRFDVVVLDWSQDERPAQPTSPLGPMASWHKPTVLLGSAGLLLGEAWEISGTIG